VWGELQWGVRCRCRCRCPPLQLQLQLLFCAMAGVSVALAGMLLIGPGGPQSGFSTRVPPDMYQGTFAKKKSGPRTPHPPGGPPVLGSLVWRAEGLPSTRNWSFRWPLSPPSPPPGDTQGNVSRQLAGAVVLGGGAAPAPPLAGSGRSCASSIRVP
jgi:hypothetical protein